MIKEEKELEDQLAKEKVVKKILAYERIGLAILKAKTKEDKQSILKSINDFARDYQDIKINDRLESYYAKKLLS